MNETCEACFKRPASETITGIPVVSVLHLCAACAAIARAVIARKSQSKS